MKRRRFPGIVTFIMGVSMLMAFHGCSDGGSSSNTGTGIGSSTGTGTGTGTATCTTPVLASSFTPNDPYFGDQWHLKNTGQKGGVAGEDLNVTPAWTLYKGNGVRIAVVDDGMDIHHEDLSANVVSGASYNYCDGSNDPTTCASKGAGCETGGDSCHGTAVAGLAAAVGDNGIGVSGVAPNARLVGYALLNNDTISNEQDSMSRGLSDNQIYSNSWGAPDGKGAFFPPTSTWTAAIDNGTANGRGGKGAIYTWAAGNGYPMDRSDYDGQANYHGVFAVAAVGDNGKSSSYSEPGANLLVSAYGGEFCDTHTLTTTDMTGASGFNANGINNNQPDYPNGSYTKCMNGTSGATPQVSGAVALMLEANPELTWRDVRLILARTARKNDPTDRFWVNNAAGLHVNQNYGYGVVDATAAVAMAKCWINIGPQITFNRSSTPNIAIPDATGSSTSPTPGAAVTDTITVVNSGISAIEYVDVTFNSNHPEAGDLNITVTSPSGTASTLTVSHKCLSRASDTTSIVSCGNAFDASNGGFRFGVARLMNETADGTWTLSVQDQAPGNTGTFQSWQITIFGR